MTWLALLFAIELGVSPYGGWAFYDEPRGYVYEQVEMPALYTELEAEALLLDGHVSVDGAVRTWVTRMGRARYAPFWATYDFGISARFGPVEAGWRHQCTHPVQVYTALVGASVPALEGGYGEFYIRYGHATAQSR